MRIPKIVLRILILIGCVFVLQHELVFAQTNFNPPFPRTADLHFGGGSPDWLARFNLLTMPGYDSGAAKSTKALNPGVILLPTSDWMDGSDVRGSTSSTPALPTPWAARHANGSIVTYDNSYSQTDITNYSGLNNGEMYNQALARVAAGISNRSYWDGNNSDGLNLYPWDAPSDIDLDRNGVNDYSEHGQPWIEQKWKEGGRQIIINMRSRFQALYGDPNRKIVTYNSGTDSTFSSVANGIAMENQPTLGPLIANYFTINKQWESTGPQPRVSYVNAQPGYDAATVPAQKKDHYKFMRWMLGVTLMTNMYFSMDDAIHPHYYNFRYDEFDTKLGYPTGDAQTLSNGCKVRFFDNGCAIVNATNSAQTVTNADLSARTGYAGPYYRFKGNQDTTWNNGQPFTSVSLQTTPGSQNTLGVVQNVGDGIILLKTPKVIVEDIIVDNAYGATSAGSLPATITGFSFEQTNTSNPLWSTGPYWDYPQFTDTWKGQYALAGSGSATAAFTPGINVAGQYQVYEWHGWRNGSSSGSGMASNVPCTIVHGNGSASLTIDQSKNFGKWNLLGTYTFRPSGNGSVTITNKANGTVVADAFRFVYVGPESGPTNPPDGPAPSSPGNGSVNQPTTILLAWNASSGASSYRVQVSTDSSFATTVLDDSTVAATSRQVGSLANNTTYYWRVNAKNSAGVSVFSSPWHFTTVIAPPSPPALQSPVSGSVDEPTTLTLTWNTSATAASYAVQVSADSLFGTTVLNDSTVTTTSRQVGPLANSTKYFWRVKAKNAGGSSPYSGAWNFTTLVAPPPPPALQSPASGAVNQPLTVTMSWNASSGATSYRVQVSTDSLFGSIILDDSTVTGTSRQAGSLANNTTYYWRVNAKNSVGVSAFSSPRNFTTVIAPPPPVPALQSPASGSVDMPTTVTLTWSASATAASYTVQVSADSLFGSTVLNDSTVTTTSTQTGPLANSTKYFWRVKAKNGGGTSSYSIVWNFMTIITPPAAPVLSSPANGSIDQPTAITLSWNASSGASSYRVQVSMDSSFAATLLDDSTVAGTSRPVGSLANITTYYWRVSAKNSAGVSVFSSPWNFTTIIAPPALQSPASGSVEQPTTLTLTWSASPAAASYTVQVSTDSLFGTTVLNDSTVTTTSRQVGPLANSTRYFWRVKAENAGGTSSGWNVWNFMTIVIPPEGPVLSSPVNGSVNQPTATTLAWNASSGATSYRIELSTDSLFGAIVLDDSTLAGTSRQAGPLSVNTTYYWKVRAANSAGASAYSAAWSFTTGAGALPPPASPVLLSPSNGATGQSAPLTLNWAQSSSASSYRVQVSVDSLFGTTVLDDSTPATGSKTINSLLVYTTYYWRVNARNSFGVSPFSAPWTFQTKLDSSLITLDQPVVDFGKLHVGSQAKDSILLGNSGSKLVNVSSIQASTSQFSASPNALTIPPGSKRKVYITFAPTLRTSVSGKVLIRSDSLGLSRSVSVSGKGTFPAKLKRSVSAIVINPPPGNQAVVDSFQVSNEGDDTLIISSIKSTTSVFSVSPASGIVAGGDSLCIHVTAAPTPSRKKKQQTGYIIIGSNSSGGTDSVNAQLSSVLDVNPGGIPTEYALEQNYPNPFNPSTTIEYALPGTSRVILRVYDMLGVEVVLLVNEIQETGIRSAIWNSIGKSGYVVPSGVYYYRLEANNIHDPAKSFVEVKKMIFLK